MLIMDGLQLLLSADMTLDLVRYRKTRESIIKFEPIVQGYVDRCITRGCSSR